MEEINFSNIAIAIFPPNGDIIFKNKQQGLDLHIYYLKELYNENEYINKILKDIDFEYYQKHLSLIYEEVIPLFQQDGSFVFINLGPNVIYPTNCALFFLSETKSEEQKIFMDKIKEKFKEIEFYDIGKWDNKQNENISCLADNQISFSNYEIFYTILDTLEINNGLKK